MCRGGVQVVLALTAAAGACAGCGGKSWRHDPADYVKPTVAVIDFENRAAFPLGWKLGDGMKDVLVDRLVATGRFQVIERPELGAVLNELRLQNSGATRPQRRAAGGRIKNVQYLIKGTVTDFGHVSRGRGFFDGAGWHVFGGGSRAVMGMTLYVVEVESGEIICSESLTESVRATDAAVKATYKGVAFGGSSFYRTPLGRATAKVIGKAVRRVCGSIAARPWEPKIALVQPDGTVVINGGKDRQVRVGMEYEVYELGEPIVDPDTGDVIGHQAGTCRGRLRVREVNDRYSVAVVVDGRPADLRVGQRCREAVAVAAK